MNERIDQLLVKAGAYFGGEGVVYDNFDTQKFAELIVRECADIATIHQQNHAHDSIGRYVLDHFGIEERE